MLNAKDVADFFLSPIDEEDGESVVTNLKLQKLLYYAQGYTLALLDRKLFDEEISCWNHGPVVESIYYQYKAHGRSPLPPSHLEINKYNDDELCILHLVRREYGQYEAWKLRDMTHEEAPFLNTPKGGIMDNDYIKEFFFNKVSQHSFNFDIERMRTRVEGNFVKMPSDIDQESFIDWVKSI